MKLSTENINKVFNECLYDDGENTEGYIEAKGVMMNIGFHPERLKANNDNIVQMLSDLPDTFRKVGGGGMSFLAMCETKDGGSMDW